jgi:hypothetical protein
LYDRRQRRGTRRVGPYVGVVKDTDLVHLFEADWDRAVRVAARVVGSLWAEDIVQAVFLSLVERRDEMRSPPDRTTLLVRTKWRAISWLRGVHKRIHTTDGAALADIEAMMYALEKLGRARSLAVTVPSYSCPRCAKDSTPGPRGPRYCSPCLVETLDTCSVCLSTGIEINCTHPAGRARTT